MTALTLHTVGTDWIDHDTTTIVVTARGVARTYRLVDRTHVMGGPAVGTVRTTWEEVE
jgi:hypothetical protein